MSVFVLDKQHQPLMPCTEKRARKLLTSRRARIHRLMPFVIRLVDRKQSDCDLQPVKVKVDPGSKATGLALVRESESIDVKSGEITTTTHVLSLMELIHRGHQISEALTARRQMRRRRRSNLRYREPRFLNRSKPEGWLAPSLQHRVDTTVAWVNRFKQWLPVTAIAQELVRFDMQQMQNPDITGVEYQQGTLQGYEVREYLLEKWGRQCVYCDTHQLPLQIEHIHPKSLGGTNRVANLALSCGPCNLKKNAQSIQKYLSGNLNRLTRILAQTMRPLKDAAAVNTTRWALLNQLKAAGVPVTTGSGGLTKFNRVRLAIPKTHALDAICVGEVDTVSNWQQPTLAIKATGRGSYQRTRLNAYGFPRGYLTRQKNVQGFQTGDRVKAFVTKGKKAGVYTGRVAVRASGSFNIQTAQGVIQGISHRCCEVIQRADGYGYSTVANVTESREQGRHTARIAAQSALSLPGMNAEVSRAI